MACLVYRALVRRSGGIVDENAFWNLKPQIKSTIVYNEQTGIDVAAFQPFCFSWRGMSLYKLLCLPLAICKMEKNQGQENMLMGYSSAY